MAGTCTSAAGSYLASDEIMQPAYRKRLTVWILPVAPPGVPRGHERAVAAVSIGGLTPGPKWSKVSMRRPQVSLAEVEDW